MNLGDKEKVFLLGFADGVQEILPERVGSHYDERWSRELKQHFDDGLVAGATLARLVKEQKHG